LLAGDQPGRPGPIILAQRWLAGDQTVLTLLNKDDEHLTGKPIPITEEARVREFRLRLYRRLVQAGRRIIKTDYLAEVITGENEATNALVQQFTRSEFTPFANGGDSHLDFRVRETPDPRKPIRLVKQLYLEAQVTGN